MERVGAVIAGLVWWFEVRRAAAADGRLAFCLQPSLCGDAVNFHPPPQLDTRLRIAAPGERQAHQRPPVWQVRSRQWTYPLPLLSQPGNDHLLREK